MIDIETFKNFQDFSRDAQILIFAMIHEIQTTKHIYRIYIEGCFDMLVENYGYPEPQESKNDIVDFVEMFFKTQY